MDHHYDQNEFATIASNNFAASYSSVFSNGEMHSECKASTSIATPRTVAPKRSANGDCQFCKDRQISAANWCRHLRRKHPEVLGLAPLNNGRSNNESELAKNNHEGCSSATQPKRKSEIWKYLQYFPNDRCMECHKEMRNLSPWNAKRHLIKKHPEALGRYGLPENEVNNSHSSTYEQLLALTEESCSSQSRWENDCQLLNNVQNGALGPNFLTSTNSETAKLEHYNAETQKIKLECEKLQLEKKLLETQLRLKTIEVRLAERQLGDEGTQKVVAEADARNRVAEARLKELQVREMEIKLGLLR
uniref:BED-type domain-containing protein n=1 Tax=Ditylenchus dipsaci TaxID=166011 RepID=A0A915EV81_9BILA